ncbi:MAG: TIGR00282 family metallophosphoesterase [Planctomycetes bacterium]|nr:TIGR00282 family metallophosphoesterase [Planctomycetota bacterium]
MRILIIGDVVGRPGRQAVTAWVPKLRRAWQLDYVIANAENAASGSGITPKLFRELSRAGVDLMTLGDHAWKRRDNLDVLAKESHLLRPLNYPASALGSGAIVVETSGGVRIGFATLLGRVFMSGADCPFAAIDRVLESFGDEVTVRIVEIHAEASSEKIAFGWYLDGRVSCVFGTHTHVPTADERVLPGGTAYITDLGMTGPYDGVIGRETKAVLYKFTTSMHATFNVAERNAHLCGVLLEVDRETGRATAIRRVDLGSGGGFASQGLPALAGPEDLPGALELSAEEGE